MPAPDPRLDPRGDRDLRAPMGAPMNAPMNNPMVASMVAPMGASMGGSMAGSMGGSMGGSIGTPMGGSMGAPMGGPMGGAMGDRDMRQPLEDQDLRTGSDPRFRGGAPFDPRSRPFGQAAPQAPLGRDDPRMGQAARPPAGNTVISAQDQEKAALIMQVCPRATVVEQAAASVACYICPSKVLKAIGMCKG